MFDRLIGAKHHLGRRPECADDPVDLGLLIFDELHARIRRPPARGVLREGGCRYDGEKTRYGEKALHRTTSGSAR
jgi:hypothetical protein